MGLLRFAVRGGSGSSGRALLGALNPGVPGRGSVSLGSSFPSLDLPFSTVPKNVDALVAQYLDAGRDASTPAVKRSKLSNGVTVVSVPPRGGAPPAGCVVGLYYRSGTSVARPDEHGVPSLLTRLVMSSNAGKSGFGTQRALRDIPVYTRALSGREHVGYELRVGPGGHGADTGATVRSALETLVTGALHSKYLPHEIASAQKSLAKTGQVVEALDDWGWVEEQLHAIGWHSRGLGWPSVPSAPRLWDVTPRLLMNYVAAWHQPSRAVVIGAGALSHEDLEAAAEHTLGSLPRWYPSVEAVIDAAQGSETRGLEFLESAEGREALGQILEPEAFEAFYADFDQGGDRRRAVARLDSPDLWAFLQAFVPDLVTLASFSTQAPEDAGRAGASGAISATGGGTREGALSQPWKGGEARRSRASGRAVVGRGFELPGGNLSESGRTSLAVGSVLASLLSVPDWWPVTVEASRPGVRGTLFKPAALDAQYGYRAPVPPATSVPRPQTGTPPCRAVPGRLVGSSRAGAGTARVHAYGAGAMLSFLHSYPVTRDSDLGPDAADLLSPIEELARTGPSDQAVEAARAAAGLQWLRIGTGPSPLLVESIAADPSWGAGEPLHEAVPAAIAKVTPADVKALASQLLSQPAVRASSGAIDTLPFL